MNGSTDGDGERSRERPEKAKVEKFRNYLKLLAESGIRRYPEFRGKIDSSDIVQDTLLQAIRGLRDFRGSSDAEVAAWLRKILARQLLNRARALRCEKRDVRRERPLDEVLEDSAARFSLVAQTIAAPAARGGEQGDLFLEVADALVGLPDLQREAFVFRHFRELRLEQIAKEMGLSRSQVSSLLRQAIGTLRKRLRGYEPGRAAR